MFGLSKPLNLPDWFETTHWASETICTDEPYVEGELTLYPGGDAKVGTRTFPAREPIDNWPFAGGLVAKRRIDRPEWLVIRTPQGKYHYYRYRSLWGSWERYIAYTDQTLDRYCKRFGPRVGSGLRLSQQFACHFGRGVFRAFLRQVMFGLAIGIYFLFVLGIGLVLWLVFFLGSAIRDSLL